MATIPVAGYISNASRPEGEFKQAMEDTIASLKQVPGAAQAELTNTISAGSITPAGSGGVIVIDTEAAAATDDLTNIVTTNYPDGSMLLIRNANAARVVVVKHLAGGAGQMNLDQSGEYTLDDTKKWLLLQRRSADWYEVFRGPQRPLPVQSPIINGSMEVWQRGTAFAAVGNTAYSADRWRYNFSNDGVITINRSTSVPTVVQAGVLFNYSLEADVTTADATLAAAQVTTIVTRIEGYNWRHFAQRQFTLSFWVYATKTGAHCVSFSNSTQDRSYIGTYVINTTNTWEYKTITVSPSPSAGTWDYTNGIGLEVAFCLGSGTNYHTAAGAWQTGQFFATSAQVNDLDSTSNFFRLTGVRMELGPIATPSAYVDFQHELGRCQRYYQKSFPYATAPVQNVGGDLGAILWPSPVGASTSHVAGSQVWYKVPMRVGATVTLYNPNAANAHARNLSNATDCSATSAQNSMEQSFAVITTTSPTTAGGHTLGVHWAASAEL
jgi:hypothetical protein